MKQKKLKSLADMATFKISLRSKVMYTLIRKEKGRVIYTSNCSGRTFYGDKDMIIYA